MRIIYTKHTLKRMKERGIKSYRIKSCIQVPDYNVQNGEFIEPYKRIENQTLKVVWVTEHNL